VTQMNLPFGPDEDDGRTPAFLTIAEAAARVRVCERTVRRAIDHGNLRAARVRGSRAERGAWRIRPEDLELWIWEDDEESRS
jgi:excisionase family DNA binding protein